MARRSRRGEVFFSSNRRLPPVEERVRLFTELEAFGDRQDVAWPGAWGVPPDLRPRELVTFQDAPTQAPSYRRSLSLRRQRAWMREPMRVIRVGAPEKVAFCIRRKDRREVLFAKRVAGRRGIGRRGVRRRQSSQYRC